MSTCDPNTIVREGNGRFGLDPNTEADATLPVTERTVTEVLNDYILSKTLRHSAAATDVERGSARGAALIAAELHEDAAYVLLADNDDNGYFFDGVYDAEHNLVSAAIEDETRDDKMWQYLSNLRTQLPGEDEGYFGSQRDGAVVLDIARAGAITFDCSFADDLNEHAKMSGLVRERLQEMDDCTEDVELASAKAAAICVLEVHPDAAVITLDDECDSGFRALSAFDSDGLPIGFDVDDDDFDSYMWNLPSSPQWDYDSDTSNPKIRDAYSFLSYPNDGPPRMDVRAAAAIQISP